MDRQDFNPYLPITTQNLNPASRGTQAANYQSAPFQRQYSEYKFSNKKQKQYENQQQNKSIKQMDQSFQTLQEYNINSSLILQPSINQQKNQSAAKDNNYGSKNKDSFIKSSQHNILNITTTSPFSIGQNLNDSHYGGLLVQKNKEILEKDEQIQFLQLQLDGIQNQTITSRNQFSDIAVRIGTLENEMSKKETDISQQDTIIKELKVAKETLIQHQKQLLQDIRQKEIELEQKNSNIETLELELHQLKEEMIIKEDTNFKQAQELNHLKNVLRQVQESINDKEKDVKGIHFEMDNFKNLCKDKIDLIRNQIMIQKQIFTIIENEVSQKYGDYSQNSFGSPSRNINYWPQLDSFDFQQNFRDILELLTNNNEKAKYLKDTISQLKQNYLNSCSELAFNNHKIEKLARENEELRITISELENENENTQSTVNIQIQEIMGEVETWKERFKNINNQYFLAQEKLTFAKVELENYKNQGRIKQEKQDKKNTLEANFEELRNNRYTESNL